MGPVGRTTHAAIIMALSACHAAGEAQRPGQLISACMSVVDKINVARALRDLSVPHRVSEV